MGIYRNCSIGILEEQMETTSRKLLQGRRCIRRMEENMETIGIIGFI